MSGLVAGVPPVTPVAVFEELRFVWELFAAEALLLSALAPRRRGVVPRVLVALAVFSALSLAYFPLSGYVIEHLPAARFIIGFWYIVLALALMDCLRRCFGASLADALYVGVTSYAAQHVVYVAVHEYLALSVWPGIAECLPLYVSLSLAVCAAWYAVVFRLLKPLLRRAEGRVFEERVRPAVLMAGLLVMLFSCTFTCQYLFHLGSANQASSAIVALLVCFVVIGMQLVSLTAILSARERAAMERMMRDAEAHSALSRDLVDYVNRSVHDLKHALRALETLPAEERGAFVEETQQSLRAYERMVFSDNETLNTLLTERALACEAAGVEFACSVGAVDVGFLPATDLYVLLGNLVDNALEATSGLVEERRRVVSLSVHAVRGMLLICCDNPFDGALDLRGGLPRTTKADRARHGFGLRSIQRIAEKNGGALTVDAADGVFFARVAIPLP